MNWQEGLRRIGIFIAVPLVALTFAGVLSQFWQLGNWANRNPYLVALGVAVFIIGWWIIAGFRKKH
jgi:hypothetical protein